MVVTSQKDREDVGNVLIDEKNHKIISFSEKDQKKQTYINAGIYIFNKKVLENIPKKQNFSLEYSLFPQYINKGFYGFISNNEVIDIGTPERYKKTKRMHIIHNK